MTESEYEYEYAGGILDVLEAAAKSISSGAAKNYRIEIRYNAQTGVNYIADEDLDAINQLIVADWEA